MVNTRVLNIEGPTQEPGFSDYYYYYCYYYYYYYYYYYFYYYHQGTVG